MVSLGILELLKEIGKWGVEVDMGSGQVDYDKLLGISTYRH